MDCPKCKVELQPTMAKGVGIDYCPKCKGLWLEKNELKRLDKAFKSKIKAPFDAPASIRNCPECQEYGYMVTFNFPETDIPIDMCKQCDGIWLDVGEFKAIKRATSPQVEECTNDTSETEPTGLKAALLKLVGG